MRLVLEVYIFKTLLLHRWKGW